jgi:hypothetical protein
VICGTCAVGGSWRRPWLRIASDVILAFVTSPIVPITFPANSAQTAVLSCSGAGGFKTFCTSSFGSTPIA